MATAKKPSEKQLAARKLFAQRAKDGTFAKKRTKSAKAKNNGYRVSFTQIFTSGKVEKSTTEIVYKTKTLAQKYADQLNKSTRFKNARVVLNKGLKKPVTKGLTTLCAKTVGATGRRKSNGTQKKGYVATKGGTLKRKKS